MTDDETVYTTYQHERQLYDQERELLDNAEPCEHSPKRIEVLSGAQLDPAPCPSVYAWVCETCGESLYEVGP